MTFPKHTQAGFSMVETLVAITILLIVITGPMVISSQAANSTSFSSEQVVAFFLAQEGAEIIQKARDDLILKNFLDPSDGDYESTPWADFSDTSNSGTFFRCFEASGCRVELNTDTDGTLEDPESCSDASGCRLYYDDSAVRARYTHDSSNNEETPYTRIINMQSLAGGDQVRVVSRVYWRTGSNAQVQQVETVTYLFNVYGN